MPKYAPTKLTIRFVENLPPAERDPTSGRVLSYSVRDTLVPGLMVVVNANSKSFAVQRDFYAQERDASGRRIKLGTRRVRLGDAQQFLSIEAVRAKAAEVIASLKAGIDPNTKAPAQEVAQPAPAPAYTLGDAIDAYVEVCQRKGRRSSTISGYEKLAERYLGGWVGRPLEEVGNDPLGVDRLHRDITHDHGPVAANQTMRLLRAVYRSAARKMRNLPPCPTDAVDWNAENRRTLVVTDWAQFFDTMDGLRNPVTRSFYYFLALTGSRKGAAEAARAEHVNWERGFIHIPDPKGGPRRAFDLPLGNRLLALLRAQVEDNKAVFGANYPWLFPSHFSSKV
ncbi:integrase arm-type DNA-binding domain-containing protein [Pseudomonas sp. NW5]|uniref:integrase arm-type DNA-binding domain-containing protein n=1 Tax=Pseudomonas sp. NW5 TaxID=2934934 RepID=UPI002021D722|nr:integrase arm-type DNA-binding domain-containing protein [Pseudomonas sp. NW5]MCL7463377.1 integrase arm-type DNA-binding domain-containing protein [Pseudomonas sp. NW5]